MATTPTGTPMTTGLKYTYKDGDSYKDWYFANTGMEWDGTYLSAKPEGMSDADWTQGILMQKFDASKAAADATRDQTKAGLGDIYKQQTSAAQQSFNSMANQYNTQMKGELEYAGVLHERMKKYLPQQMRAAGMGNTGIAQTAGANAAARHMSTRAGIIGQNQASMNELSRNYGERQAGLDAKYAEGMMAADATYNSTIADLNSGRYEDDLALFGQTVKDMEEKLTEGENRLKETITGATTREEAQAWLDAAIADGTIRAESKSYFEQLIANQFNAEDKATGEKEEVKATEQLNSLLANGVDSATLTSTLNNMIAAGTIQEGDRAYWEGLISTKKAAEEEEAAGKVTEQQKQSAAEAESLILQATTAEQRASVLATYQGAVSEAQYRYLQNLAGIADGNQSVEDTQAGQQKASEQLTSLFAAGASSADIRTTYDQMLAAGTITAADKPYWDAMLSTLEKEEADKAAGKISAEQADQADWARELLGNALNPTMRAEILEECKAWVKSGKITQEQYDAIKAYADVIDSNDEYLKASEEEQKAMEEHDALVDDIIGYIVDVAKNYDEANKYYTDFVSGGEEFSEAEKRSIDIALKMRQNMDDDDALVKMTEEQSKAYDRCVNMMGLYDTVEGQRGVLEKYKDELAPEVYEEFKAVLDVLAEDPETKATEEEQAREDDAKAKGYGSAAEYDAAVLEGKEYIEHDGSQYKINGEALGDDSKLLENEAFLEALANAGFDNPYSKKIPNGTTLTFNVKPNEDGTFNWKDVVTILAGLTPAFLAGLTGLGNGAAGAGPGTAAGIGVNQLLNYDMQLMYYNGSWYPVKAKE